MIILRDAVHIRVSPGQVFDWLERFCEFYCDWHPDHISCAYLHGSGLEVGSIVRCEEYLHGQPHQMKLKITRVIPNSCLEYSIAPGFRGSFRTRSHDRGVEFVAELALGVGWPFLGRALDWLLGKLLSSRLAALETHMREEGQNLKSMLESLYLAGASPEQM